MTLKSKYLPHLSKIRLYRSHKDRAQHADSQCRRRFLSGAKTNAICYLVHPENLTVDHVFRRFQLVEKLLKPGAYRVFGQFWIISENLSENVSLLELEYAN